MLIIAFSDYTLGSSTKHRPTFHTKVSSFDKIILTTSKSSITFSQS